MADFWAHIGDFSTTLAIGSAGVLIAGLSLAALLSRAVARAHATLVVAAVLAIALPAMTRIGRSAGLGVLPAAADASNSALARRDATDPENLGAPNASAG